MNVNLEYYRVFYYVCVHGSLTAAARELCISQPAVSQAVRQLEKEAGIKLFLRTSKGVQLTKEGELLYRYVKIGVESLLEGEKMVERVLGMDMGGGADWRQRYDPAVFPASLSGTVSQGVS